jgi:Holliday junction resolvase RusA-like endonuclease
VTISLWIAGKPQGKARPRMGKGGHVYTPAATKRAEADVSSVWREVGEPRLHDGAVSITIENLVERPSGHFNSKGELNAEGLRHPYPDKQKPDLDNSAKLVMDALNGRAYKDDVRVVDLIVRRRWAERAGIRVVIYEME